MQRIVEKRAYFETREEARIYCGYEGIPQSQIQKHPTIIKWRRWSAPVRGAEKQ